MVRVHVSVYSRLQGLRALADGKHHEQIYSKHLFLFRVPCWSQCIVSVHGREWGRGSIHTPPYKVVIVYIFHLSNCNTVIVKL